MSLQLLLIDEAVLTFACPDPFQVDNTYVFFGMGRNNLLNHNLPPVNLFNSQTIHNSILLDSKNR